MHLTKRDWRTRFFFWSLGIWDKFRDTDTASRYKERTSLCHFMRVIVLWAPFVFVLHLFLAAAAIGSVVMLPIHLFGWVAWLYLFVGGALLVGIGFIVKRAGEHFLDWLFEVHPVVQPTPKPAVQERPPSTWELILAWIVALKQKVCPIISFVDAGVQKATHA